MRAETVVLFCQQSLSKKKIVAYIKSVNENRTLVPLARPSLWKKLTITNKLRGLLIVSASCQLETNLFPGYHRGNSEDASRL